MKEYEREFPWMSGNLIEDVGMVAVERLPSRGRVEGIECPWIRDDATTHGEAALLPKHDRFGRNLLRSRSGNLRNGCNRVVHAAILGLKLRWFSSVFAIR